MQIGGNKCPGSFGIAVKRVPPYSGSSSADAICVNVIEASMLAMIALAMKIETSFFVFMVYDFDVVCIKVLWSRFYTETAVRPNRKKEIDGFCTRK